MIRMVLRDYRMNWKEGLSNVSKNGSWFVYLYLLIVPANLFGFMDKPSHVAVYYGILFPLMLGLLLSRMYPNRLSKTMFLCPMKKEERKRYIVSAYWIRVLIPIALFALIGLILVGVYQISVESYVFLLASEALFIIGTNLYIEAKISGYTFWQMMVQLYGLIFIVSCIGYTSDLGTPLKTWEFLIFFVLLLLQGAATTKLVVSYWRTVLEVALDYEWSERESRNVKNEKGWMRL
ncbi:MAG: hypothetical protein ACERKN_09405 [Velocimicrobium sp.]